MDSSSCFNGWLGLLLLLIQAGACHADTPKAIFDKAAGALAAQDYASAERGFLMVLKAEPGNIGALGNLGVVYTRTRRYSQAIDVYRRGLRMAPGDPGLETNLGLAYFKQERYREAIPIFKKLAADSGNLQARELLATCHLELGQPGAAIEILEPLRAADPANAGILYLLGVAFVKLKRPDEARAAFSRMMDAVSPAQANYLMGKANYETGRFEDAAQNFRNTLADNPAFPGAHRELGKTLLSLRDNEGAERELRQADPNDAEAVYFLGGLLAQTGQPEAVKVLTRAHDLSPDSWGPLYYLGRVYLERQDLKHSLSLLERAAKLKPDEPAIQYQLARALRKAGREAEARAALVRLKQLKASSLKSELDAFGERVP